MTVYIYIYILGLAKPTSQKMFSLHTLRRSWLMLKVATFEDRKTMKSRNLSDVWSVGSGQRPWTFGRPHFSYFNGKDVKAQWGTWDMWTRIFFCSDILPSHFLKLHPVTRHTSWLWNSIFRNEQRSVAKAAAMECCGDGFLDFCGGRRPKVLFQNLGIFSVEIEGWKSMISQRNVICPEHPTGFKIFGRSAVWNLNEWRALADGSEKPVESGMVGKRSSNWVQPSNRVTPRSDIHWIEWLPQNWSLAEPVATIEVFPGTLSFKLLGKTRVVRRKLKSMNYF